MAHIFRSTPADRENGAQASVPRLRSIRLALPLRSRRRLRRWLAGREAERARVRHITEEAVFV